MVMIDGWRDSLLPPVTRVLCFVPVVTILCFLSVADCLQRRDGLGGED